MRPIFIFLAAFSVSCVGFVDELPINADGVVEDVPAVHDDEPPRSRPPSHDLPDPPGELSPEEESEEDEDALPPAGGDTPGSVPGGGACDCDVDCEATAGLSPLCIHGICGVRATDDRCTPGSTSACPPNHRCWSGTGRGVCYPDYVEGRCEGRQDQDGSCVSAGVTDCYAVCGELCDLSGSPPGDFDPVDPVDPDLCEYPSGPYRLGRGHVAPPMAWSSALPGASEVSEDADLEALMCEPEVRGVFIYAGTTWCSACGQMLRDIASQRSVWSRNGVRWVFLISDLSSASQVRDYLARYGIDFGFATNDVDNSEGRYAIVESGLFSTIPWIGVIRTSDMVMTHDMASAPFDPAAVAESL